MFTETKNVMINYSSEGLRDLLLSGGTVALIGFLIVFLVLIIIILAISLMSTTLGAFDKKHPNSSNQLSIDPDYAIIAVISAALDAYLRKEDLLETSPPEFIIRRIRRSTNYTISQSGDSLWN
jgi:sodium pump decarboxylase gamma subunit